MAIQSECDVVSGIGHDADEMQVPEVLMRVLLLRLLAWSVLTLGFIVVPALSVPANAQAYDPRYPVCMKVYQGRWGGEWIDCSYTSLPQCRATASGRAAMCDLNPFFAPPAPPPRRAHRRHR